MEGSGCTLAWQTPRAGVHLIRETAWACQHAGLEKSPETCRNRKFPSARLAAHLGLVAPAVGYTDERTAATRRLAVFGDGRTLRASGARHLPSKRRCCCQSATVCPVGRCRRSACPGVDGSPPRTHASTNDSRRPTTLCRWPTGSPATARVYAARWRPRLRGRWPTTSPTRGQRVPDARLDQSFLRLPFSPALAPFSGSTPGSRWHSTQFSKSRMPSSSCSALMLAGVCSWHP